MNPSSSSATAAHRRSPVATTPPMPVGSSASISIGRSAHPHQVFQQKLAAVTDARTGVCRTAAATAPTSSSSSSSSSTWH